MDHLVITVRPAPSDEALLEVGDAMQQVLDTLSMFKAAQRALGRPQDDFVWRLERASANSPFTVVAIAEARNPTVDVSGTVGRVKSDVARGLREILQRGVPPAWMGPPEIEAAKRVLLRHQNGVGRTEIDFEQGEALLIDRAQAESGIRALAAVNAIDVAADLPEREAFGEIEGLMVAAGRYRNRPAIQIRSELYGFIWCVLSNALVEKFGGEHTMADIWEGKTIGVQARLYYAAGGKLTRADAIDIREIQEAPPIDLESILDPDFTAGMDPHEYLRRLHDGSLA